MKTGILLTLKKMMKKHHFNQKSGKVGKWGRSQLYLKKFSARTFLTYSHFPTFPLFLLIIWNIIVTQYILTNNNKICKSKKKDKKIYWYTRVQQMLRTELINIYSSTKKNGVYRFMKKFNFQAQNTIFARIYTHGKI